MKQLMKIVLFCDEYIIFISPNSCPLTDSVITSVDKCQIKVYNMKVSLCFCETQKDEIGGKTSALP